jgi:hypothetical protein
MSIEDTSKRHPLEHLAGSIGSEQGFSEYIVNMEKDGQKQLAKSGMLPVDRRDLDPELFDRLGFKWGPPAPRGELFQQVTLPPGWEIRASDHPMWSYVRDEQGRERFSVFYKAAFYDRSAHMGMSRLFSLEHDYDQPQAVFHVRVQVPSHDGVTQWKRLETFASTETFAARYSLPAQEDQDKTRNRAIAWLDEKYPDRDNPLSYWELKF